MTKLKHPMLGIREFTKEHAERLMSLKNNGGWEIAQNADSADTNNGSLENKEEPTPNGGGDKATATAATARKTPTRKRTKSGRK